MNTDAIRLAHDALWLVLILSAPIVVIAALVGLAVSFVQSVTQIQEQTLGFTVKFFVIALVLFVMSTTLGGTIYTYTDRIFSSFPKLVRR